MKTRVGSVFLPIDEISPSIFLTFRLRESATEDATDNPISGIMGWYPRVTILKGLNNTYSVAHLDSHKMPIVDNSARWGSYCVNYSPGVWLVCISRAFWGYSGTVVGLYDQTGSYPTFEVLASKSSPSPVFFGVRLTKEVMRVLQRVRYRALLDGGCRLSAYHAIVSDCKRHTGMIALVTDNTTWFVDPTGVRPPSIEYRSVAREVWTVISSRLTNAGVELI